MAAIITRSNIEVWTCNSFLIREMLTKLEWLYHIHSQHKFVIIAGINTSTWCWGTTRESNALTLPHSEQQFLYTDNPFYLHLCRKSKRKAKVRLKFLSWYWGNVQKSKGEYCFLFQVIIILIKSYACFHKEILKKGSDHHIYAFCVIFQRCHSTQIFLFFTWYWREIFFPLSTFDKEVSKS